MKRTFHVLPLAIVFSLSFAVISVAHAADTVIYDSISSGSGVTRFLQGRPVRTTVVSDPTDQLGRSYVGNAFNTTAAGSGVQVDRIHFIMASSNDLTSLSGIQVNIQFWNSFGSVNAPNYFSNAAGGVQTFTFNSLATLPSGISFNSTGVDAQSNPNPYFRYDVDLTFALPVLLTDSNTNGVAFNIKNFDGTSFVDTNDLTVMRTRGDGFLVGSSAVPPDNEGGYLRNRSGETNFNFSFPTSLTQPAPGNTVYEALGVQLYGAINVPETNTLGLLALGIAPVAAILARRKKKA